MEIFITSQTISVAAKRGIADLIEVEAETADELAKATGHELGPFEGRGFA
jgi:hypothetical protein